MSKLIFDVPSRAATTDAAAAPLASALPALATALYVIILLFDDE
ncbi:hypothetical protein PENARI_c010G01962 [Penicillium arizonense]|uniref:Uncharacterized protein n=1 Tax=Penicillium arizonense TaxID=1835702 RepID=A0A1F5LI20_PENAI|nr:hypothetical protein PENARI_c010G01962 [Penicillium arizonense]OGE52549.1 hypothetical protein PENARI_c010G01962 [Penicillium arizonense]